MDLGEEQGQHPRIVEVHAGGALAVDRLRLGDPIEHHLGQETVLAERLDLQQSAVGGKTDGPQGGQVVAIPSDAEVVGVVDRGFAAQGAAFLEVLLDLGGFVADVQRRDNPLGNDVGVKGPGRAFKDPPIEDRADLLGPSRIEVFADRRLEQGGPDSGRSNTWVREDSACRIESWKL